MPHIEGTCSLIISNECGSTVFGFDTFLHTVDVSFDPIHLISCYCEPDCTHTKKPRKPKKFLAGVRLNFHVYIFGWF